uniref:Glycos_transf_2 n=1 Tax=uncultured Acetohalobium sp. TaxID=1434692 RepID=A0A060C5M9_9FIRM|nr:Glycos_transf_2 [uncultured Acetohalobium sp.]
MERCLTAVRPILDEIPSELIIADTGSTDRTLEISKQFTDKVFHFEWCNDFSAARNAVLKRAQGKWFLSLDGDEIFENPEVIAVVF